MSDRTDSFYAAEGAIQGYGAQIELGDGGSPEAFEAIHGVRNIKPGEITSEDIDRTHLRSPGRHREHAAGMRDSGMIEGEGIYSPDEQSLTTAGGGSGAFQNGGLPAIHEAGTNHNWRIVLNDGSPATTLTVRGYLAKFSIGEITPEGIIPYVFGIMPSEAYDHP